MRASSNKIMHSAAENQIFNQLLCGKCKDLTSDSIDISYSAQFDPTTVEINVVMVLTSSGFHSEALEPLWSRTQSTNHTANNA